MNLIHRRLCRSEPWAQKVRDTIMPAVTAGVDLGDHVLELGPGPGRTTELLVELAPRLTAVEVDPRAARALQRRLGAAVDVVTADAAAMPFADATFSAAVCLTMLHHVPSPAVQDAVFAEVARVLRPDGVFTGCDSIPTPRLRLIHVGDTLVPVDPATLPARLTTAGFAEVQVRVGGGRVWFRARRYR